MDTCKTCSKNSSAKTTTGYEYCAHKIDTAPIEAMNELNEEAYMIQNLTYVLK